MPSDIIDSLVLYRRQSPLDGRVAPLAIDELRALALIGGEVLIQRGQL